MKAIVQDEYGSADVLELRDVEDPVVGDKHVLVRVHAAGCGPDVWHLMTGQPLMARPMIGLRGPKERVRGWDVAGTVEALSAGVTTFQLGDEVMGVAPGSFAEYAMARADKLTRKPARLSFAQAAAVPVSGVTALQALRDKARVRPGQTVLIVGAAGGVGTFAVQIAKAFGAQVTGVCSTTKLDFVRSIGADDLIDYTREDFTGGSRRWDVIVDTAGRRALRRLRRALTSKGTLVIVGGDGGGRWTGGFFRGVLRGPLVSLFVGQKLGGLTSKENQEDLRALAELIEAGTVTPVVDRTYPLVEAADAIRYLEEGHPRARSSSPSDGDFEYRQNMRHPVMPPVKPMLAKSVPEIPKGDFSYEPKWDGFRSIVFRDGDEVEIGSRNERPMTRYFPEVVEVVKANLPERFVIDGEIVVPDPSEKRLEFETLQQRIHPAESRVRLLAKQTPAHFIAFDLLALSDRNLIGKRFAERRRLLEEALTDARSPVHVTPATTDRDLAVQWFEEFEGAGLDGIVAKPLDVTYQPDKRVMFKIKHERTADCVVAGYRVHKTDERAVGSLLLGLYDENGDLANVGVVGALPMAQRRKLFEELQPLVTTFEEHPWNWAREELGTRTPRHSKFSRWSAGKDLTFVPLRPERVVEIRYDHMEGPRLRHTGQFVRWRPDRDPRSCTFDQLEEPVTYDLAEILGSKRSKG